MLIDDGRWAETKIGPERARSTYPFKSLLDSGVRLACGSDWPVAPMDPSWGSTPPSPGGRSTKKIPDGWIPEQKIPLEEAIKGFTSTALSPNSPRRSRARSRPGNWADLVVLDRNLFEIKPEEIREAEVALTIVGGNIVFRR